MHKRYSRDGLYRRENGIWAFRYKDNHNAWREKYTGTTNRQDARAFKTQYLQQAQQGTLPNELAKLRLEEAIRYYLDQREGILGPRTWKVHHSRGRTLLQVWGNKRLDETTNRDLDHYQNARCKASISGSSINKELELLIYLLRKAKLWKRFEDDYKPLPISHMSPRRPVSLDEFVQLVRASLTNPDWEVACMASVLAANTTCRSWEIKSLRLSDIDLNPKNRKLIIRRENTKSDAGARDIELNALALWAVHRLLDRAHRLGAVLPEHYLLPADLSRHTKTGDPLKGELGYDPTRHQQSWRTAWTNMRCSAGLPWVHFHDLRHTAITAGREQGVEIGILKAIAGHMNVRMTEYYSHIGTTVRRNAVDRIAEAFRPIGDLLGVENGGHKPVQ